MVLFSLRSSIRCVTMPLVTTVRNQQLVKKGAILMPVSSRIQQRYLFLHWINSVFNRIDRSRVEEVGPDRACAEWLLRNGAVVQWVGATDFITDYNDLPLRDNQKGQYFIKSIDATESSIMAVGFPHFDGCNHIEKITLKKCGYLDDEALQMLCTLKKTLKTLEIISCWNLTSKGLVSLACLENLKILKVEGLSISKDQAGLQQKLRDALPNCEIFFDKNN